MILELEKKELILLSYLSCYLCQFNNNIENVGKTVTCHCDIECMTKHGVASYVASHAQREVKIARQSGIGINGKMRGQRTRVNRKRCQMSSKRTCQDITTNSSY